MKTPVIIPAYNEADHIGPTLRALDADTVEPFVIVNGEKGAQETAEAALKLTPNVFIRPEQGKLPAIQFALRMLLDYDADAFTRPILMSDADSRPLRTTKWAHAMGAAVEGNEPRSAGGLVLFNDGPIIDRVMLDARRIVLARRHVGSRCLRSAYGSNMAFNFANRRELIDEILNAPHIWPGEDRYLLHVVGGEGEREHFSQLTSIDSTMLTSARFNASVASLVGKSAEERHLKAIQGYASRRAQYTEYYFDEESNELREHAQKLA